jgi:hypothetical protein
MQATHHPFPRAGHDDVDGIVGTEQRPGLINIAQLKTCFYSFDVFAAAGNIL